MREPSGTLVSAALVVSAILSFANHTVSAQPAPKTQNRLNQNTLLIDGLPLDSRAMHDSLANPFWWALAAAPCPAVAWSPDYSSAAGLKASAQPILRRLRLQTGVPLAPAGFSGGKAVVAAASRYSVERVAYGDRIPHGIAFGFLLRPKGMTVPSPALIMIPGSGMLPEEAFAGGYLDAEYLPFERSDSATFVNIALEFAEAGYTVLLPRLAGNERSDRLPYFPWAFLARNGASLAARTGGISDYNLLLNAVASGVDYLSRLPNTDIGHLAAIGWGDGVGIVAAAAALDPRVKAVVQLAAPLDRRRLRATIPGIIGGASFTHSDCALGDVEMAALIAPRPLMYTYSPADASVARFAAFQSPEVVGRIQQMYGAIGHPDDVVVVPNASWNQASVHRIRTWLDTIFSYTPRAVPNKLLLPRLQSGSTLNGDLPRAVRDARAAYVATLGACVPPQVSPDYTSTAAYSASVEPFRTAVGARLGLPTVRTAAPFQLLERRTVSKEPGYTLDFVVVRSPRTTIPVQGLLAVPDSPGLDAKPAVISFDGDYGLGRPFDLPQREVKPYLNAYAARLAAGGVIVFVPYIPEEFPEIAASELLARDPNGMTSYGITLPLYSAAVDYLLSLPIVDKTHIAAWGISYSATTALYATAFDSRITALLYSNPITTTSVLFQSADSPLLATWWPEICSTHDLVQQYLVAPRLFIRENGVKDANGYEHSPLESIEAVRDVYHLLGIDSRFVLSRHGGPHETRATSLVRSFIDY